MALQSAAVACRRCAKFRSVRWVAILVCFLGALCLLLRYVIGPLIFWQLAERCERPTYDVLQTLEANGYRSRPLRIEIRRYAPYLVAEVRLPADLSEQEQRALGFRQVAGYIFGGNKRRRSGLMWRWAPRRVAMGQEPEKIAMTAPVQTQTASMPGSPTEAAAAETTTVSFTMPSKYRTMHDLPLPDNRNVTFRAVPEHIEAVVGFRGPPPKPGQVVGIQQAMEIALSGSRIQIQGGQGALVYQYHDPFATPNILRWNEVALLVDMPGV
mmetsp:Transcript_115625/g.326884  ORF Transcript_115625/g.326884 Transcript_115625/m.326884 type:complete len:269 (+) Transcript_115625:53-859(+)